MTDLRVLAVGDIVGRPGRRAVKELLPGLRDELGLDFVIANAENAAGGSGVTLKTARELLDAGCDVLTTGDHFYDQKSFGEIIEKEPRVLRPANWSRHAPGRGSGVFETSTGGKGGAKIAVVNLIGRVFMKAGMGSFFDEADDMLDSIREETPVVCLDFHAEVTSEKTAFGRYLDGRVSFFFGTHTHVPTADARVLPGGTAYVTDIGMTGPHESVIGSDYEAVLTRLRTGVPARFEPAKRDVKLQGALAVIDPATGRAKAVERVEVEATNATT